MNTKPLEAAELPPLPKPEGTWMEYGDGYNTGDRDFPTGQFTADQMLAYARAAVAALAAPVPPSVAPEGWKLLKDTTDEERSWPDDVAHENGYYSCRCLNCLRMFTGHKRRAMCRVCAAGPVIPVDAAKPATVVSREAHGGEYLCCAWGESDWPVAAIVADWSGVRQFIIDQWLGDADAQDYDGTPTLPRLKEEFDAPDWDMKDSLEWKFEIGGVRITKVFDVGVRPPAGGEAVTEPCLGALMQEQRRSRTALYPDGNPNANVRVAASPVVETPHAYEIYIPAEQRGELVYDLEDAIDDLTNCECKVTPLFSREPAHPVEASAGPTGAVSEGQWHVFSTYAQHEVRTPTDTLVAVVNSREHARLISAAPEMLSALYGVLRVADRATMEFDAVRAAIAKAAGQ